MTHKITGVRCTKEGFHEGLHSFDTVDVSSDISAWKNKWPRALLLEFAEGPDDDVDGSLLGAYNQARDIVNRRPMYEHETASAILVFGLDNTWAVRRSTTQAVALQLKDSCRTPDRSKRAWQKCTDGRLENVVGLRCVVAPEAPPPPPPPPPEAVQQAEESAAAANADDDELAAAQQEMAAFIGDDDDDDEWWHEPLEASAVE